MNYYKCNPEKAIRCKKTICYINGGNCKITSNIDYAKDTTPLILQELENKNKRLNVKVSKED